MQTLKHHETGLRWNDAKRVHATQDTLIWNVSKVPLTFRYWTYISIMSCNLLNKESQCHKLNDKLEPKQHPVRLTVTPNIQINANPKIHCKNHPKYFQRQCFWVGINPIEKIRSRHSPAFCAQGPNINIIANSKITINKKSWM